MDSSAMDWSNGTPETTRQMVGKYPVEDGRTPPGPSPAGADPLPLKAPIHQKHGENERAIQAAVADELPHGFDRVQLRVNNSFHKPAHSQ
jgi:hypothetical protein